MISFLIRTTQGQLIIKPVQFDNSYNQSLTGFALMKYNLHKNVLNENDLITTQEQLN